MKARLWAYSKPHAIRSAMYTMLLPVLMGLEFLVPVSSAVPGARLRPRSRFRFRSLSLRALPGQLPGQVAPPPFPSPQPESTPWTTPWQRRSARSRSRSLSLRALPGQLPGQVAPPSPPFPFPFPFPFPQSESTPRTHRAELRADLSIQTYATWHP